MAEPHRVSFRGGRLASLKVEEAAWRRHQAAAWLESMVGSFGLPPCPTEQQFVAVLRNGIVLCKAINKVHPGAVQKVITNAPCDSQPLTAFQYFENIRNFLVAVQDLKLPTFEASDLEKDNMDIGSVGKIVDSVISLKSYHEWKQVGGASGSLKHMKSPLATRSSLLQPDHVASGPSPSQKRLHMADADRQTSKDVDQSSEEADVDKQPFQNMDQGAVEKLQKVILDCILSSKENFEVDVLKKDPVKLIGTILASQLGKEQFKHLQLFSPEGHAINNQSTEQIESCSSQIADRQRFLEAHETELVELKKIFRDVKVDLRCLQTQFQNDMTKLGDNVQELCKAAFGYNQAVKENRNLYNMLQELRGNIRVFCRIRPLLNSESFLSIEHIGNDGSVMICDPFKPQNGVYKETQPLIRSVMDGYNVCIFAYGQTGSGKTHTMCGPSDGLPKDLGINYLALNDLFNISTSRQDVKYDIRVQMVEIYNEQLGEKHRASGSTAMNHRSSRSHSILTVHVNGEDISGNVSHSSLHLVDLAGSERVDRSEATGDRLKEAQHINKSLSCLGDVINALAQKNSHIPYRNSKLTQLLQSSLGGNAKTLMFAHISPEAESYAETLSTLKFAQRASTVELGTAYANRESSEIRELKEQVDNLKKALASKELENTSLKLKENTIRSERLKQLDRTPPRSRRLSLENVSSGKSRMPERKTLKSPCLTMNLTGDQKIICDKECSTDDLLHAKHHTSVIQAMSETFTEDHITEENKKIISTVDTVEFHQLPADTYTGLYKQSGLNTPARTPCRIRDMSTEVSHTDDPCSTAKLEKVRTSNTMKKGSHLRKSIQSSIGKLIHGSEKRNVQHSVQETPAKTAVNACTNIPSPSISELRLRRQSLTGLPPPPSTMSRRSSLGGKSDISSNDKRGPKTPPPVNSTAKLKRWL
ncbi:hypothetical protein QOZ80_1AG0000130 [Eleusine coracana subsp. coracana]|nr:hypothetical protein QOZ80_1AG0000130 [Eleusine coracana subsp. coracana]